MCGIAGLINGPDVGVRISRCLAHRGPDDEGTWESDGTACSVLLIHRRLTVIDLSPAGHQPMRRGSNVVVFNGEIYNYRELRRTLEDGGARFDSNSDTEVILAAYERWGVDCVARLRGMFAFALWDSAANELLLARDRIGKKPLFYRHQGSLFGFGSEIKAILAMLDHTPPIDDEALDDYLTYLYIPYPRTIFRGIRQLPPGSWMRVKVRQGDLSIESGTYWDPLTARVPAGRSAEEQRHQLEGAVDEAVACRMVSDVPIGVLLSGGVDSSAITAMMARRSAEPVRCFTIGFEGNANYDETAFARTVANRFGCQHTILGVDPSSARNLARIVWHFDQPFGNPTAVLAYELSRVTRRSVTVALAGDGGDELFGGYPRYAGAYLSQIPRALPAFLRSRVLPWIGGMISDDLEGRHQFRRVREFLECSGMPLIDMYLGWVGYFSPVEKSQLYSLEFRERIREHDSGAFLRHHYEQAQDLEPLNRLAYVDIKSFLCCNVLEYADRMSMAHALELRAPLTDHHLAEFALQLPFTLKYRYGKPKWLLKQAMMPYLGPGILNRRKSGLNPPLGGWLTGELKALTNLLLSPERIRRRGLFCRTAISNLLNSYYAGKRDFSLKVWALIMLELWHQIYVDGASVEQTQADINNAVAAGAEPSPGVYSAATVA